MKNKFRYLLIVLFAIYSASASTLLSVNAQGTTPPETGAWGEVLNPDGSVNYTGMVDNGVVTQPAEFMPSIPGIGQINAEYHVYTTTSGNQILMPTATTLFFMAASPDSALYTNPSLGTTPIGISGAASSEGNTLVGIAALGNLFSGSIQSGGEYNQSFFNSVLGGEQNIWQVGPTGIANLFASFMGLSLAESSLYTYMIMVPPGGCTSSPAGCTPEQLTIATPPPTEVVTETPAPVDCPPPQVVPGKISFDGQKVAPNYPLVVGQDPGKRGVDFLFSASVAPTKYITYVQVADYICVDSPGSPGGNSCGVGERREVTGYHCEQHVESYDECIDTAHGSVSLSQSSRDWILKELSIRYPEAYLHKPEFGFGSSSACSWSDTVKEVPIADPGYWDLFVNGSTAGTPVSGARDFGGKVDTFEAWLKEIAIIK